MDLTVESTACPARTMAPAPSHFVNFTECGGVERVGFTQASSGRQPDFLPVPRFLGFARSGRHRAHHTPVGLGNYILVAHRRQNAEWFLILLLEDLFCPACMVEG